MDVQILWRNKNSIQLCCHMIVALLYCTKFLFGSLYQTASITRIQHIIYNGYASVKTFTQTGTHTCTHTNIHTHDPMPTHTLTFHPYDPLSKTSELAEISIFSQHQTNWMFFWKQTPTTQTNVPWLRIVHYRVRDMRYLFVAERKSLVILDWSHEVVIWFLSFLLSLFLWQTASTEWFLKFKLD